MKDAMTPAGALFSPDRRFRYLLWRRWSDRPLAHFCMLNPSIADETDLDPTLRRCKGFAEQWGMGGMLITNLFPLVATDPKDLIAAADRSGPWHGLQYENDGHIERAAAQAQLTVVGWGTNVQKKALHAAVPRIYHGILKMRAPKALRVSRMGHPVHPLYLPYDCKLTEWRFDERS